MLLARRQRQHEAAPALGIDSLTAKPPGHLPDELLVATEQAEVGPAELEPDAERLPLTHDDIGAEVTRRFEQAERHRLGHHRDQQRTGGMRRFSYPGEIGNAAEDIGIL